MKTADNSLDRFGVIILNKLARQTKVKELILPECFEEETPIVLKDLRFEHKKPVELMGFNRDLHPLPQRK
jgi:hypothetical protein